MTRTLVEKPNGDAPRTDYVAVELPGRRTQYLVTFSWGEPEMVVGTHRRVSVRRDYLGREKSRLNHGVTRAIWDLYRDGLWRMSPTAQKVVAEAVRLRAERFPVVEKTSRLLDA